MSRPATERIPQIERNRFIDSSALKGFPEEIQFRKIQHPGVPHTPTP